MQNHPAQLVKSPVHGCMQALQCLVSILRSLVDWYMRSAPGGAAAEGVPLDVELQAALHSAAPPAATPAADSEAARPDWEHLASRPSAGQSPPEPVGAPEAEGSGDACLMQGMLRAFWALVFLPPSKIARGI